MTAPRIRCPQEVFDLFQVDPFNARQKAFDWLMAQPKDRRTVYVVPPPEDGSDMDLLFSPSN